MARYSHIFFDLDGTLADTSPGITASVRYALERMGRSAPDDPKELFCFIGPPLLDSFQRFSGFTEGRKRKEF